MAVDFKYRAFISYSHADHASAVWLHKALEKYPIHKKLVGLQTPAGVTSKRIGRVFRDEAELGAIPELGPKIEAALQDSDTLIVLCSPNSAQSQWVAKEVTRFKELGRQNRVLALILDGEPNASDPTLECFPEPLKWNPDGSPAEPLAVDVRKFGREDALVRIVSGILDIEYDQLKQRDLERRRAEMRRAQGLFAAGLILLISALGAGFLALKGFSDLAHANSDILAREAKVIYANGEGDKAKSLLMALQADPSATRNYLRRFFAGEQGYPLARARLVNAVASRRLVRVLRGHEEDIDDVAYAPDGKTLVTVSYDRTAKLWDAETGALLNAVKGGIAFGLSTAFAPDGKTIFVAQDNIIHEWDPASGQLTLFGDAHKTFVIDLEVSGDGRYLASASWDGSVKIWDIAGRQAILSFDDHVNIAASVAFGPRSNIVATGSGDIGNGVVKLWDLASGELLQTYSGHSDLVSSLAFSPDGEYLASGSGDNTVKIWDLSQNYAMYTLRGHQDLVSGLAFSADSRLLMTASEDKTVRIWDPSGNQLISVLSGHTGGITELAASPDGQMFATVGADQTARIWRIRPGELVSTLVKTDESIQPAPISGMQYAPDGTEMISSHNAPNSALLWDPQSGTLLRKFGVGDLQVTATTLSPDGSLIASGLSDSQIRVWNKQTGALVNTLIGHEGQITNLVYSPDGSTLISSDHWGFVFIWDAQSGRMRSIFATGSTPIDRLKLAPDGQSFATANNSGEAAIWAIGSGTQLMRLNTGFEFITAIDFSPDGTSLVTGNDLGEVREWDLATQTLQKTYSTADAPVWSASYSPDGMYLLAGTDFRNGASMTLWDTKTGERMIRYMGSMLPVSQIAIAPDATSFASENAIGGNERIADIWRVPDIIHASSKDQVRIACETLWAANAPLHFTQADAQAYPVLLGEPIDPETGDFLSPCIGILPDAAFAR